MINTSNHQPHKTPALGNTRVVTILTNCATNTDRHPPRAHDTARHPRALLWHRSLIAHDCRPYNQLISAFLSPTSQAARASARTDSILETKPKKHTHKQRQNGQRKKNPLTCIISSTEITGTAVSCLADQFRNMPGISRRFLEQKLASFLR